MKPEDVRAGDLSPEFVIEQVAVHLAKLTRAVLPLIERTEHQLGAMGGSDNRQSVRQTVSELQSGADALLRLYGLSDTGDPTPGLPL